MCSINTHEAVLHLLPHHRWVNKPARRSFLVHGVEQDHRGDDDVNVPLPVQPMVKLIATLAAREGSMGDCTDAFVQSPLHADETIFVKPPSEADLSLCCLAPEERITWSKKWSDRVSENRRVRAASWTSSCPWVRSNTQSVRTAAERG